MKYENWKLRRAILASEMEDKVEALIIIDHADWKTGQKKFTSKRHYENWIDMLAAKYNLKDEPTEYVDYERSGSTRLKWAVWVMTELGFAQLNKETKTLTLISPGGDDSEP